MAKNVRPQRVTADELAYLSNANKVSQDAQAAVGSYLAHLGRKYAGAVSIDAYTGVIAYPAGEPAKEG